MPLLHTHNQQLVIKYSKTKLPEAPTQPRAGGVLSLGRGTTAKPLSALQPAAQTFVDGLMAIPDVCNSAEVQYCDSSATPAHLAY